MTLNLAHYEKVYNSKFKIALSASEKCVEAMGRRPPDMNKEFITRFGVSDINWHKGYYQEVCTMIGSILFSSGYWHSFKIRKQKNGMLIVIHDISIMTDAEKEENLKDPDALELSDDESSDDEVETV